MFMVAGLQGDTTLMVIPSHDEHYLATEKKDLLVHSETHTDLRSIFAKYKE